MPRSVDLFIETPAELAEVAEVLGQLAGTPLVLSSRGDRFVLSEGEAVALLGTNPSADDGELLLSRYAYVLSARVAAGQAPGETRELALLRHMAELIRQRTKMGSLLVHDLHNRDKREQAAPVPAGAD